EEKSIYPVLETMAKNQLRIPVYCGLIDIAQLDAGNPYFKTAELFDFNSLGIPGTYNKQLHQKLPEFRLDLKQEPDREYQLGLAGSLADIVGLVGEAAAQAEGLSIRATINEGLKQYIHGQRIFRGWFSDLYFTAEHAFAGNILVAWKPRNHTLPVLAPMQFLIADTILNPTQVLYTSLDMVRIDQINDEEEAFLATFYLQIKTDQELDIDQLDFTNASRNAIDHEPLLEARLIRTRQDTTGLKFRHYLYKISGKFQFDPDLKEYPLDQQAFPISIQPGNALKPFLIQPAHPSNRDTIFQANGWTYKYQYVGFDKEIISSSNAFSLVRKNIPYYKFTFEYVMKRLPIDYFLKTLMPLFTILTIAYMSVYIPPREFEALAAIQVTALLSSIALYFSTYKPQIQYATSSDKIFIFSYVMVTTLIGSSILIYIIRRRSPFLKRVAQVYQRILFPLIIFGFTVYIRWF
ncbi:MAG TPA: hypothetical protein VK927_11340, partial [Adhaeribacter sp.]|nr:hypothetical protein [Adhaeribacter sp.]